LPGGIQDLEKVVTGPNYATTLVIQIVAEKRASGVIPFGTEEGGGSFGVGGKGSYWGF